MRKLIMWNKKILFLTVAVGLLFSATNVLAQGTGRISGKVVEDATGEPMIGVNVGLRGTSLGNASDIDGDFVINRIPAGNYTLVATSIGYENFEAEVEIVAGETLELNISMMQQTVQGEEVIVSAQAQGQREAINEQLQSDKIVNVVSETKIQELPDFNAAAALGRLPGVSTTRSSGEDNKVVIRGLSPEYNSIEVEGIKLASTGSSSQGFTSDVYVNTGGVSNDRSVDLTSVSPYMIRMISVYKSLTPDMNANSIGGTVNMELREAPEDLHWSAMWQQGYTAKSNTVGNYRAVISASDRFMDNKLGVYGLFNVESYDRNSDNMSASYGRFSSVVDPETGFRPVTVNSVTFNRHTENRNRYGANLIMDYRLPKGSIKFLNMYTRINSDYTDYNQTIGYNNGRMGWRLQQGENIIDQRLHSLKLDYDLEWINIDLSASFTGSHNLLDGSPVINFNQTSAVTVTDDRVNRQPEELLDLQDSFQGVEQIILRSANLFSSDFREEKFTYKADFEIPFNVGTGLSGSFKFGGQFDQQSNSLNQEAPYMGFDGSAISNDDNIANNMMAALMQEFNLGVNGQGFFTGPSFLSNDDDLFDPFLDDRFGSVYFAPRSGILVDMVNYVIGNPLYDASNEEQSGGRQGGWYDGPFQQLTNDYSFDENYYATYAMTQFTWGPIFFIGGARYEKVSSDYFAYNAEDIRNAQSQVMIDTTSNSGNEFLLPMGQIKYSPVDWMDVRYAYTQTLARPRYNDLSPKFTIPNGGGSVNTGNPDLKPAQAYNHDLNVTFHANKLGLFSVGVFYKTIENFVYGANYSLDVAELAGIDNASNYQVFWSEELRQRLAGDYPFILNEDGTPAAGYEDGQEVIGPAATQGAFIVPVNKPLNNPFNATVRGLEIDFQHNFWYLPGQFKNIVLGINYARISSEYKQPFYDVGERFITPPGGGRPQRERFLIDSTFTGRLANQPNHVINTYIGYDFKGFSARFSLLYESSSAGGRNGRYPANSVYTDEYLKLDFSARQKLPFADGKTELFMDVSNLNGANTERRQTSIDGFSRIENYGLTANLGVRIRY
jgi:TonB-dependent receptor